MESVRQEAPQQTPREYLIYFVDRPGKHWWDYVFFTREGFRHCFMMSWDQWAQRWLMIDWLADSTNILMLFDFEAEKYLDGIRGQHATVVRFTADLNETAPSGILTYCSNLLARFLGLGKYLILTPEGLYRKLLATGGEVVYSWRDHDEAENTETESGATAA